jgi:alpha-L-rhamnosidase
MIGKLRNPFIGLFLAGISLTISHDPAFAADPATFDISQHGAIGDGTTLNTKAIQSTIDQCAAAGGGTVVIPTGEFVSGSLFLKSGVNLQLLDGAVLKGSANIDDYALKNSRIEGHFEEQWHVALLNAEQTDHLRITGPGTLDGNGPLFWKAKTPNGRPRLCFVRDSSDVTISGVHFKDSASWNLHFYNCKNVTVENSSFEIPDKSKGPATDGTDVDSSQNVTIRGCTYSVDDDCVCLKGSRGPDALKDTSSLPVSNVHVTGCTFKRGMGALTLGSEATQIRDVEMDHCTVTGRVPMLRLKMRPDTPGQDYENVRVHDIKLDGKGVILSFELTHGTKVAPQLPKGIIHNISVSDIAGAFGSFGKIAANGNTNISVISLKNIDVKVNSTHLDAYGVTGLTYNNVIVNGTPVAGAGAIENP